jgi:hypothetical protein
VAIADTDALTGKFYESDKHHQARGVVVARVRDGIYLVQPIGPTPPTPPYEVPMHLVTIETMTDDDWRFYDKVEAWEATYRAWSDQRDEELRAKDRATRSQA